MDAGCFQGRSLCVPESASHLIWGLRKIFINKLGNRNASRQRNTWSACPNTDRNAPQLDVWEMAGDGDLRSEITNLLMRFKDSPDTVCFIPPRFPTQSPHGSGDGYGPLQ